MNLFSDRKKVLLRGPVLTQSGYGVHTRQIAAWLLSKNVDLEIQALPWGETPWIINENYHNGLIGKIMEKCVDVSGKRYDTTFQVQLPNEWDSSLGVKNIGITAGVETDRCNPEWIVNSNKMSCIVVPSQHAADSLNFEKKVQKPIHVIPESYSEEFVKKSKTKIDDVVWDTPFNFLFVGQVTGNNPENDRKNIFYMLKWFCETFKDDHDVGIVMKINTGRNTKIDKKVSLNLLEKVVSEVRKNQISPKIHLLHGDLTNAEMSSLFRHNQIKAFISLTRGEGFGLPLLEAAVSELPIIATGWSGHHEFLKCGKYIDINYKLSQIHSTRVDENIFMKDANWANPIEEDVKKKIQKFKNSPSLPKEWAISLSKKLIESHSAKNICAMYDENLKEFL